MLVSQYLLKTLRESPSGAELPSHIFLLRGGYIKQLASGLYSILPLGKRILEQDRSGDPRRDGQGRGPGSGPAPGPARRTVDGIRPLRRHRRRTAALQGSLRAPHGAGHDPRGGHHRPGALRALLLQATALHDLAVQAQVPRRAPRPRRPGARARVHHEGRLQLPPQRRGSGRLLQPRVPGLREHLRPRRHQAHRGQVRHRHHGRQGRPRVHAGDRATARIT